MSWSYAGDSSGDRYSGFAARQATADYEVLSMWACTFDLDEGGSAHGLTRRRINHSHCRYFFSRSLRVRDCNGHGYHERNIRMQRDRRSNFRVAWNLPATIHDPQRHLDRPCVLSNFSNGGAQITGVRAATIPDEFMLQITLDDIRNCRTLWRTDDTLGVEFTGLVTSEGVQPSNSKARSLLK
jgi:hypothetical protein